MKTCNKCGVELDVDMNYCPLCGHKSNSPVEPVRKEIFRKNNIKVKPEAYDFEELTDTQKRKIAWEIIAIILVSGIVATFLIDLIVSKNMTWSRYTITTGLFLLINTSLFMFVIKKPFLFVLGCFINTSLMLLLMDLFNHSYTWGLKLGVPIAFSICLVMFFLILVIKKSGQKGINVIAYSLVAAAILCFFIEGAISFYTIDYLRFRWSIIVIITVVPVASILAYIHFRLRRVTSLRKFFHI